MLLMIERDLLKCLDTSEWKSIFELGKEVRKLRLVRGERSAIGTFLSMFSRNLGDAFSGPTMSELYAGLEGLGDMHLTEWRSHGAVAETILPQGDRNSLEWRLTIKGIRAREENYGA